MRLELAFRLSLYVTLSVASVCLALAADPFLPGFRVAVVPLLALFLVAYCLEGRVAIPAWAANLLGITILLGGMVWAGWYLYGRARATGLDDVAMPSALLPFLGPFLIILMFVKLLRPKYRVDYWVLQGLGLVLVTLSCVLGQQPLSGLLLLAYFGFGLWHLAVFFIRQEIAAASNGRAEGMQAARVPFARSLIRTTSWTGTVLLMGLPLFLLLPRQGRSAWDSFQWFGTGQGTRTPRIARTGFANEINLNRTGPVELSDEIAFFVRAEDGAGRPKLDLPADQRWRGAVLEYYDNGRWLTDPPLTVQVPSFGSGDARPERTPPDQSPVVQGLPLPAAEQAAKTQAVQSPIVQGPPLAQWIESTIAGGRLPDLGPSQFYLIFSLQSRAAGGLFLAEPVAPVRLPDEDPNAESHAFPVVSFATDARQALRFHETRHTLQPGVNLVRGEYSYRQVSRPSPEPDLSEPVDHLKAKLDYLRPRRPGRSDTGDWTTQLLERLAAKTAYGLTKNEIEPVEIDGFGHKVPRSPEKVAVALSEYLAHSGEYIYTLNRRREDTAIDPTLDFLQNIKQGHCERFAGALALMLRSLGMQTRVVIGYRGAESQGDGIYAIRQNFAHSWVEVLVERKGADGAMHWHWRTLDPTPSTAPPFPARFSWARWWEHRLNQGNTLWHELVLNYGSDQQDFLLRDTAAWLWKRTTALIADDRVFTAASLCLFALTVAGTLFALRLASRLWPRRPRSPSFSYNVPFYTRLLALLARHGHLRPKPSQTPREFAEAARSFLISLPTAAAFADVPARLAELLYRVRYGARPLSDQESQSVEGDLQRLALALADRRNKTLQLAN